MNASIQLSYCTLIKNKLVKRTQRKFIEILEINQYMKCKKLQRSSEINLHAVAFLYFKQIISAFVI